MEGIDSAEYLNSQNVQHVMEENFGWNTQMVLLLALILICANLEQ